MARSFRYTVLYWKMTHNSSFTCLPSADDAFGPWAGRCRGGFDFTLLFEESILALPVSCLLILSIPVRMLQLASEKRKVVYSPLQFQKLSAAVIFAAFNTALLVLWATQPSSAIPYTRISISTALLSFLVALGFGLLSFYEHTRSVRPSSLLSTYLLLSTLMDTARARTLWMIHTKPVISSIFTCSLLIRCVLLLLESTEKRSILLPPYCELSKESTSGSIDRSVFFWLTSLFIGGYQRVLSLGDLYPLDPQLQCHQLQERFNPAWDKVHDKTRPNALPKMWISVQFREVIATGMLKLCVIGFNLAQPLLLSRAIALASTPETERYNDIGYGLTGAYALVYVGIAISTGQYAWRAHRLAVAMRGCTIPLVYRKTLHLETSDTSQAAALTLATTDIETMTFGIVLVHDLWGSFVEVVLAIYLLQRNIGAACAVPVGFGAVLMMCMPLLAKSTASTKMA